MLTPAIALCTLILVTLPSPSFAEEKVDLSVVNRIRTEAFTNSKVMDTMFYLTDVLGPRLTNSPNFRTAGEWAVKQLSGYGLANVKEEKWGPFGRSWQNKYFEAHMTEPQFSELLGVPLAWTEGTSGSLSGEPMLAVIRAEADMDKFRGKLRGKIVMTSEPRELPLPDKAEAHRYSDIELAEEAMAMSASTNRYVDTPSAARTRPAGVLPLTREERLRLNDKIAQFMRDEGALLVMSAGTQGEGGTIFAAGGGSYDTKKIVSVPGVAIMPEQYNRIARLLDHKIPLKLEFNIQNEMNADAPDSFNIVGEIPGSGLHRDQVVMLGAHFDSWHGGTGATDNAAGSAVMMEVMRILQSLKLPMDRTVRIALWSGEEEGLLGSRAYVKEHFADRETMKLTAQHAKLDGYFNLDNGSGKIRGVYLQGNDMMRPIFESWLVPFKDLGANSISIRNTGGTDHLSFDAIGLPGFQFIQDPLDYETRTHHSNMDVYDRIQSADLMQASAVIASFVYNTATRPEMLPRKPLPAPQPATPTVKPAT